MGAKSKPSLDRFWDFDLISFLRDWSQTEKLSGIQPPLKERKNCKFTPVKNSQNF